MYALEVENLKKTYANGVEALKGISLSVEEGDFFALLGPNGAGKSTLIGIISSLVNASAGDVRVFCGKPGGRSASHRVSHNDGLLKIQFPDQTRQILDLHVGGVGLGRRIGQAVTPRIRENDVVVSFEFLRHVRPAEPIVGIAMG